MTTPNASGKPKQETKKLCAHSLTDGCHYGSACHHEHPADVDAAKAQHTEKKTLNLCGFHPKCTRPACSWLHIDLLPKVATTQPTVLKTTANPNANRAQALPRPQTNSPAQTHKLPTGRTPQKPAYTQNSSPRPERKERNDRGDRNDRNDRNDRGDRGRKTGGQAPKKSDARDDQPAAFRTLHQLRGKVNAINKIELANRELAAVHARLASTYSGDTARKYAAESQDAIAKAEEAKEMQEAINGLLLKIGLQIDGYILALGSSLSDAEDSADEHEEVSSDSHDPEALEVAGSDASAGAGLV
jgi:hypothetical protein